MSSSAAPSSSSSSAAAISQQTQDAINQMTEVANEQNQATMASAQISLSEDLTAAMASVANKGGQDIKTAASGS